MGVDLTPVVAANRHSELRCLCMTPDHPSQLSSPRASRRALSEPVPTQEGGEPAARRGGVREDGDDGEENPAIRPRVSPILEPLTVHRRFARFWPCLGGITGHDYTFGAATMTPDTNLWVVG